MCQLPILFFFTLLFGTSIWADNLEIPRSYEKNEHKNFLDSKEKCIEHLLRLLPSKPTLESIMMITAAWRMKLAREANVIDAGWFGKLRDQPIISDFKLAGGSHMQEKVDLVLKNGRTVESLEDFECPGAPIRIFSTVATLEKEEFLLTQLLYFHGDYPMWGHNIPRIFRTPDFKYTWWHTSAQNSTRIIELLERVFQDICEESDKEKILPKIAEFHWWFSQASPYMRGSAAIAEAICQALLDYKGFNMEKLPYMMIDIEVLCEPNPEEFIRAYPNFYREKGPKKEIS
ncbi:MAG: hypothetical protein FJZ60_00535 [Chlamydiae bacterium]|nr:hypothetical protein [Chlamydiota bacterium]